MIESSVATGMSLLEDNILAVITKFKFLSRWQAD